MERIEEEEDEKDNLNESKEVLVTQEKVSQTLVIKYVLYLTLSHPAEEITMKIHSPIEEKHHEESLDLPGSRNISIKEEDELVGQTSKF